LHSELMCIFPQLLCTKAQLQICLTLQSPIITIAYVPPASTNKHSSFCT
jgi:hypothetical protein